MSILIKNMTIPKSCDECPFGKEKQLDVGIICTLLDGTTLDTTSRPTSMCPLIELPPHGDLIDRDKLLERFAKEQKAADEHGRDFSFSFYSGNEVCAEWWAVENFVVDAPVVVESEG